MQFKYYGVLCGANYGVHNLHQPNYIIKRFNSKCYCGFVLIVVIELK